MIRPIIFYRDKVAKVDVRQECLTHLITTFGGTDKNVCSKEEVSNEKRKIL
jgi:hypothetical protein